MNKSRQSIGAAHLWAVGYSDMERAGQVKKEITRLGWNEPETSLNLLDVAIVVRHLDGSFTLDRESFPAVANILGLSAVGFMAGLVLVLKTNVDVERAKLIQATLTGAARAER